jgi:hypothetical protein
MIDNENHAAESPSFFSNSTIYRQSGAFSRSPAKPLDATTVFPVVAINRIELAVHYATTDRRHASK